MKELKGIYNVGSRHSDQSSLSIRTQETNSVTSENEVLILLLVKDDKLQCYDLATYVTRPSQLLGNFVISNYRYLLLYYQ
jgi:hypothetical protein